MCDGLLTSRVVGQGWPLSALWSRVKPSRDSFALPHLTHSAAPPGAHASSPLPQASLAL